MDERLAMGPPRVLMVTRRYWPHVADDAAGRLATLVDGLRRERLHLEILAARYAASWPTELEVRETRLHRPAPAPKGEWSMARYQRGLADALKRMAGQFDLLYADAMREEAAIVIDAARRAGIPSVVRYTGFAERSDGHWWSRSRAGRRCRQACLTADALLAPCASAEQTLVAAGAARQRIWRIDEGIPAAPPQESGSWEAAMSALADINADLFVPPGTPVVLSATRLDTESGVDCLVEALPRLLRRVPAARVWMIGDGPARSRLYDRLRSEGLSEQVFMPGSFSTLRELFRVADVYVQPNVADGMEHHLPSALGAGLPAVVGRNAEIKRLLGDRIEDVTTFATGDAIALADSLAETLRQLPAHRQRAHSLRQHLLTQRPLSATVGRYAKLFRQLTSRAAGSSSTDGASTMEPAR